MRYKAKIAVPLVVLAGLSVGAAFLFGGVRSAVSWGPLRAVAIESDDWGLAGFVPHGDSWEGLDRDSLGSGRFPDVYWLSTLEDSAMVGDLNRVLASHRGRDGHPAVLQPNYVMSSLSHRDGQWIRHDLPELPPGYRRPGLWEAVGAGLAAGTWYPEFHATWHYDPQRRKRDALDGDLARKVTRRDIMLFPGSESARELGPWRGLSDLARDLDGSLGDFEDLFGRPVHSVMAPDYHWDGRIEDLWGTRGLTVIQGKREQINIGWGTGKLGRLRKFLGRHWDRLRHPERVYLERNCRLEPVQAPDPAATVHDCAAATRSAWYRGEPAIVESHRVNFAHTDQEVINLGLRALDDYLGLVTDGSAEAPVFLTDHEIAQLYRTGTSWRVIGGSVVLRNGTRSGRIVAVPREALTRAAGGPGGFPPGGLMVFLPAGSTFDLVP